MLSCTSAFGQTATEYYESGLENYKNENYRAAMKDLNRAIQLNPNYAEAFFVRGNVNYGRFNQNLTGAKYDYTKTVELDPQFSKAYYNRGLVNMGLEKYAEAIQDFTKVIAIDPGFVKAYQIRGQAKKLIGDKEGAAMDFEAALDVENAKSKQENGIAESNNPTLGIDSTETDHLPASIVRNPKVVYVNLEAFAPMEKEINFAGHQLLNARRTFVVGLLLNIAGGVLMASTSLTTSPKKQLGLGIAGGITTTVGSVVMLTAVIPIGGAGKVLEKIRFPKKVRVDLE